MHLYGHYIVKGVLETNFLKVPLILKLHARLNTQIEIMMSDGA